VPHLFADISGHGLGHLAQAAPVLAALRARCPDLRLTLRSSLPRERLAARIPGPFTHCREASDFGFVMHDALNIDLPASADRYRRCHEDWPQRVRREAETLATLAPDAVFTDVAYLPLAGAAAAGNRTRSIVAFSRSGSAATTAPCAALRDGSECPMPARIRRATATRRSTRCR